MQYFQRPLFLWMQPWIYRLVDLLAKPFCAHQSYVLLHRIGVQFDISTGKTTFKKDGMFPHDKSTLAGHCVYQSLFGMCFLLLSQIVLLRLHITRKTSRHHGACAMGRMEFCLA